MKKNSLYFPTFHIVHNLVRWIVCVVIGLLWLLLFVAQPVIPSSFPMIGSDAHEYGLLGIHLYEYQHFSSQPSDATSHEVFRTPGYPALIWASIGIFGTLYGVLIIQIFIWSFVIVLIYQIGTVMFGNAAATALAVFLLLYPAGWFLSVVTLTEIAFTGLLLSIMFVLFYTQHQLRIYTVLLIGAMLGLLILVRPSAILLPVVIGGYVVYNGSLTFGKRVRLLGTMMGVLLIVLVPWILRNYAQTGHITVSSVGEYNLGWYNAPLHMATTQGITFDQARDRIQAEIAIDDQQALHSYPNAAVIGAYGRLYILNHVVSYSIFHTLKTIPFFISDSFRDGLLFFAYADSSADITQQLNFGGMILNGRLIELGRLIISFFSTANIHGMLWVLGTIFWMMVSIGWFLCPFLVWRWSAPQVRFVWLSWFVVMYFAAITGPVASARYRFVVEPLMLLLAMYTVYVLYQRYQYTRV